MNRTHLTLFVVLLAQLGLIALVRSPFSSASAGAEAHPLLPVLEAISPSRMEIEGPNDERLTLTREGEQWTVEEVGGFPADAEKIDRVLDELQGLTVRRPVVTSSRYHEAFKVAEGEAERRLRVWDGDGGDPDVELLVGSSSNYRTTHVRRAGDGEVYEVEGLAAYDIQPGASSWIQKSLVQVSADQVDRLGLTNVKGEFELFKQDGSWKISAPAGMEDVALDTGKIDALVGAAVSLRLAEAVGPSDDAAHGFDDPAATLVLGWSDAAAGSSGELGIVVGSTPGEDDSKRYITRSEFPFTGTIWDSSVKKLLEDELEGLRAAEAEQG